MKEIKTEEEYIKILDRIEEIFDAVPGSPHAKELAELCDLVEAWEDKHYPIPKVDPKEVIKYLKEDTNIDPKDYKKYL